MNLSVIVIVILSVVTLTNLCSGAFMHGNVANWRCFRYDTLQHQAINPDSCPHGWHENQCKHIVCYKDEGETCGSQRKPDLQLKYGKCAKHLTCCDGICTQYCGIPRENHPEFIEFVLTEKRNGALPGAAKIPSGQLEYEDY